MADDMEELRKGLENLTLKSKKKKYSEEHPIGILQELAERLYTCDTTWKDSSLETLDKLKSDYSGKAGELLVVELCKKGNISYVYTDDTNSKDGTYDIMIRDKKIEIKTAKLGKHKGFQHESLRTEGYDYLMFIDVCPSYYYITILPKFDLTVKSEILGRKAHLRKGATDVFKLDLNEKILESIIEKGYTIKISDTSCIEEIVKFISEKV